MVIDMTQFIKRVLLVFMRLLPLRKMIVFESHPDLSDNSFALYEELLKRGVHHTYKIYWMRTFRDEKEYHLPENVYTFYNDAHTFREMLVRAYVLNCSRYIIDCNSFVHKRRKKQVRIHLGHGMPIKIDLEYSRKFGDCDKYVVHSEFWRDIYNTRIFVPEEKLCYEGYPRNDVLVNPPEKKKWEESVADYDRVIMWMPTYRQHRMHMNQAMENVYPYGMPCVHNREQLEHMKKILEEKNLLLLFRPHPVQELAVFENNSFSNIIIADDRYLEEYGITLYQLLGLSDGLITDYSSVYFDYLLTDQPIALTIEDREEYFKYFTLAFSDYKKYIKGFYVQNFSNLIQFLEEISDGVDSCQKERMEAKRMFHQNVKGDSAARIADMLVSEYGL